MKNDRLSTILAFVLIATILGGVIYVIRLLVLNIGKINPNILVGIIAGTVTILGYFITRYLERKKDIEFQIREQKLPIYEEFVGFFFTLAFDEKFKNLDERIKSAKISEFVRKFNQKSIVWLSDDSLAEYIKWKKITIENSHESKETNEYRGLIAIEDLLLAFRKDVGHSNQSIKRGDILSIFVTDWKKYV